MKWWTPPLWWSQVSDKEDGDDVFNKIRASASIAYYVAKIMCEEERAQSEEERAQSEEERAQSELEETLKANNKKKDKK